MKEALYTIPVNDAFNSECECPVCRMYHDIENDAVEFTMGPSYMEDDIRMQTDRTGFCKRHISILYNHKNRLGLALMLDTHMQFILKNIEKSNPAAAKAPSLFRKSSCEDKLDWLRKINNSCFICDRIKGTFDRYIATIFHLYTTDSDFRSKLINSKGLCSEHYVLLYDSAASHLGGNSYKEFINDITKTYTENLTRVENDLEWFTDKFDYRNADAPWKNSKDALPRTITKTNSVIINNQNQ